MTDMERHEDYPHLMFKRIGAEVTCNIMQAGIIVASGIGINAPEALHRASCQLVGKRS